MYVPGKPSVGRGMKLAATVLAGMLLCVTGLCFSGASISVQRLQSTIDSAQRAGQSDVEIAHNLAQLDLSERITESSLARLLSRVGARTRDVLRILADATAFLEPPPAEKLASGAPSPTEQAEMLQRARNYAASYIRSLPDFVCTRVTRRFDDAADLVKSRPEVWANLRLRDSSFGELSFSHGTESYLDQSSDAGEPQRPRDPGLTTFGEFGSIIGALFIGGNPPRTDWHHWETFENRRVAVFKYAVSAADSRYQVSYCCQVPKRPSDSPKPVIIQSAYVGEISVDPGSGAILRITRQAVQLPRDFPTRRTDTVVEYGVVRIGGGSYLCPLRSATYSETTFDVPLAGPRQVRYLNDVRFTRYHRFGTESTFLPVGVDTASQPGSPVAPGASTPDDDDRWMEVAMEEAAPEEAAPEEMNPSTLPSPSTTGLTIRTSAKLVDVPVVVHDKQGNPITNLTQTDFEIYDNGHAQEVRLFSHDAESGSQGIRTPAPAAPRARDHVFSNLVPPPPVRSGELTVILIDETATEWPDLAYARQQIIRFLRQLPAGERIGLYTLVGGSFNILEECTRNNSTLSARLAHPEADSALTSWLEGTDKGFRRAQLKSTVHAFDSPSQNDSSLGALIGVAKHLAGLPGRKSVIWVSAGFDPGGVDDWFAEAVRALNDANVAVYAVDAAGLQPAEADSMAQPPRNPKDRITGGARVLTREFVNAVSQSHTAPVYANQESLIQVAEKTGGRVFLNANDITGAIQKAFDDSRDTYLLGFYPQPSDGEGRYHTIQVRLVNRPGTSLRYRRGYFSAPVSEDPKARLRDARNGMADVTGIPLSAQLVPASGGYELRLMIGLGALHLQPVPDRWAGTVQIETIQRNEEGAELSSIEQKVGLQLKRETCETVMKTGFLYRHLVSAKPKAASLRVVVRDLNSGELGSLTISLGDAR